MLSYLFYISLTIIYPYVARLVLPGASRTLSCLIILINISVSFSDYSARFLLKTFTCLIFGLTLPHLQQSASSLEATGHKSLNYSSTDPVFREITDPAINQTRRKKNKDDDTPDQKSVH